MTAGSKNCNNIIFMDFRFIYIHNQQRKRGDWGRNGFPTKRIRGARCLQRRAIEYQSISVLIFSNNYNTLAMCWFDKNRETFSFHTFMHGLFCTLHACLKKWEREDERSIQWWIFANFFCLIENILLEFHLSNDEFEDTEESNRKTRGIRLIASAI